MGDPFKERRGIVLGSTSRKLLMLFLVVFVALFILVGCGYESDPELAFYTLTMRAEGEGKVEPGVGTHEYDVDVVIDLTATPSAGWEFKEWVGDVADKGIAEAKDCNGQGSDGEGGV